jgi:ribonucleoside-diphosphate reductase alpha chain
MTTARERLPDRRLCESFSYQHGGLKYTASIARYGDGRFAQIFVSNHKSGSDADAAAKDSAVICSIALQHGVPIDTIRKALLRDARGNPASPMGAALDIIARES